MQEPVVRTSLLAGGDWGKWFGRGDFKTLRKRGVKGQIPKERNPDRDGRGERSRHLIRLLRTGTDRLLEARVLSFGFDLPKHRSVKRGRWLQLHVAPRIRLRQPRLLAFDGFYHHQVVF